VNILYDVLLDPYHFADNCESAPSPQEISTRRRAPITHLAPGRQHAKTRTRVCSEDCAEGNT
jgi:hypothetical protein